MPACVPYATHVVFMSGSRTVTAPVDGGDGSTVKAIRWAVPGYRSFNKVDGVPTGVAGASVEGTGLGVGISDGVATGIVGTVAVVKAGLLCSDAEGVTVMPVVGTAVVLKAAVLFGGAV